MKIVKQLIKREIAGDVILVPAGKAVLEHNGLFVLNPVGGDIWDLLCQGKNPGEIQSALEELYDMDPQTIARDVEEFLNRLVEMGILEMK